MNNNKLFPSIYLFPLITTGSKIPEIISMAHDVAPRFELRNNFW